MAKTAVISYGRRPALWARVESGFAFNVGGTAGFL